MLLFAIAITTTVYTLHYTDGIGLLYRAAAMAVVRSEGAGHIRSDA